MSHFLWKLHCFLWKLDCFLWKLIKFIILIAALILELSLVLVIYEKILVNVSPVGGIAFTFAWFYFIALATITQLFFGWKNVKSNLILVTLFDLSSIFLTLGGIIYLLDLIAVI